MKRAIVLSGGGPAVGLSLGALQRLDQEDDIHFDIWSTSCIGGWLAALYNQAPAGQGSDTAMAFFRSVFQPDDVYARYPVANVFTPNPDRIVKHMTDFVCDPASYRDLVVPHKIVETMARVSQFMMSPAEWTAYGVNDLLFNHILPAHPVSRFLTSMIFLSPIEGLSRLYDPRSRILNAIDFDALHAPGKPIVYHNAYNLTDQRLDHFCNKAAGRYPPISAKSLCACSALPYLEETVEIEGKTYCEGALVDTIGFGNLLTDHPDIEEIWVSRILDTQQIKKPNNLTEALSNLIMLFAAKMSENDIELFRLRLAQQGRDVRVVEIPVSADIDHSWTHSNLDRGVAAGYRAAADAIAVYRAERASAQAAEAVERARRSGSAPMPMPAVALQEHGCGGFESQSQLLAGPCKF